MNPEYKYLFGPVPSRRLGMSLGVDLVPKKVCSLNCVYCEVGPTTKRLEYIQGLVDFRKEFHGKIWLEIFILTGYNDAEIELSKLKKAILKINPNRVQLNTLDRPGRVGNLQPTTRKKLNHIIEFWNLKNVEIIAKAPERKNLAAYRKDVESAIIGTIARRPCTADDLAQTLGTHVNEINKYLETLESENKIGHVWKERGIFFFTQFMK